ncbi:1-aminocyclopropane-1-carboxylate oxidase 1 [Cucurbita pepo subsp. pepo]|uniref:1-aminocyclopropane-1-carboxylate oxidase 1 n=1 Tax=Cucurbita pepo subsp. pepo TaxID=3664 RepID=UPI000C9D7114|nr:1-aminocyclopropane-1-carboxylate oxidase 1 [Cucurbita pepo subsp. pepo]
MKMNIPTIDFSEVNGDNRARALSVLHDACLNWGFFMIENHGIEEAVLEKVKLLVNTHYDETMKDKFYDSEMAKNLGKIQLFDVDWESTFFISHKPTSNISRFPNISDHLCKAMEEEYIPQLVMIAEKLAELMCENLGLQKTHIKQLFNGTIGPSVGTKVAKYPECPRPELVRGLREHTDAGGIILLLQDDKVPGLEFQKDGQWFKIPPSKNNAIFVNIGDQIEVLTNGKYKSVLHRVLAEKEGSRLSIATFYNPASDAVVSPAAEALYPGGYRFEDYLKFYNTTKFGDKEKRFGSMKNM